MLALLLVAGLSYAQTVTTILGSATLVFVNTNVLKGEVGMGSIDTMVFSVTSLSVRQLRFDLMPSSVLGCDANLMISAFKHETEIRWVSFLVGSDTIIINENDSQLSAFNDSDKLKRLFAASVIGLSSRMCTYELKITAEYTYSRIFSEQPMPLDEFAKAGEKLEVMQITSILNETTLLPQKSSFWQWVMLGAGVGIGVTIGILAFGVKKQPENQETLLSLAS